MPKKRDPSDLSLSVPSRKSSHALFGLSGPAEFLEKLANLGISLEELIKGNLVAGIEPIGILLSGSLAEGNGNGESDIDILVLVEGIEQLAAPRGSLRLTTGHSSEVLLYQNGLEFNLEFVAREQQLDLLASLIALAPALCDASKVERFAIIERFDLRFLHRLRTGWILSGADTVERWRDEFLVDLLPTYLSIRYFFEYRESVEDLHSLRHSHPPSGPYVVRQCAESLLAALLAANGLTSQSRKWFVRSTEQLEGEAAALARCALRLMFPPPVLEGDVAERWLADLAELGIAIEAFLAKVPECATGLAYLNHTIDYADPAGELHVA